MKKKRYNIRAKVWIYPGDVAWHFIFVPKADSLQIKKDYYLLKRGWGSFPINATIGKTSWNTSIFPHSEYGTYILLLKKEIRKKEDIYDGDDVNISFNILV